MRDSFKWLLITIVSGRPPAPLNPHNPGVTSAAKEREEKGLKTKAKAEQKKKCQKKKRTGNQARASLGISFSYSLRESGNPPPSGQEDED